MEMSNHKVIQTQVDGDIAQEQTSQTTINECENEANCEQHGDSQLDVTPPQRQYPVINFNRSRHRNNQRRRQKESNKIHPHMW